MLTRVENELEPSGIREDRRCAGKGRKGRRGSEEGTKSKGKKKEKERERWP